MKPNGLLVAAGAMRISWLFQSFVVIQKQALSSGGCR